MMVAAFKKNSTKTITTQNLDFNGLYVVFSTDYI